MKRFIPIILVCLICTGILTPVMASFTPNGLTVTTNTVKAEDVICDGKTGTFTANPTFVAKSGDSTTITFTIAGCTEVDIVWWHDGDTETFSGHTITFSKGSGDWDANSDTVVWKTNTIPITKRTHFKLYADTSRAMFNGNVYNAKVEWHDIIVDIDTPTNREEVAAATTFNNIGDCGVSFIGNSSIANCLTSIVYFIPYYTGGLLLELSAKLFDTTAAFTLSSTLYNASTFIRDGWRICRDFANMFFIFILLYIAITLVLGLSGKHSNPKKMLAQVVLVAVVINFSYFMTEVVIDTSNTLALVFYNQIAVTTSGAGASTVNSEYAALSQGSNATLDIKTKELSLALAQSFHPAAFNTQTFYDGLKTDQNQAVPRGKMIMILLVAGAIFLIAAYSLCVAAVSFIGRLVSLWVAIILSPFALITSIVPIGEGTDFGWKTWLKNLLAAAFGAPVFFFFLLLISLLAKSPFYSTSLLANGDSWLVLLVVIISMLFMVILLIKATTYAKKASGEIGSMVSKGASLVGGFAIGAATGGAAVLGAQSLGRIGNAVSKNENLKDAAAKKGIMGTLARKTLNVSRGAASASYDARQTSLGNFASKKTGMNFQSVGPLSTKSTAGGRAGAIARKAEKDRKYGIGLDYNKQKQSAIDSNIKGQQIKIDKKLEEIELAKAEHGANSKEVVALIKQLGILRNGLDEKQKKETWTTTDINNATKADGTKVTKDDVGKLKFSSTWTEADVLAEKRKADGTKVTKDDVGKTNTEYLGMKELNKISEGNKKNRMNQFFRMRAERAGKEFTNIQEDSLGNVISLGQVQARSMAKAITQGRASGEKMGALVAGAFGKKAERFGEDVGGQLGSVIEGLRNIVGRVSTSGNAIKLSSSLDEKIQQYSNYTSQGHNFHSSFGAKETKSTSHGTEKSGSHTAKESSTHSNTATNSHA